MNVNRTHNDAPTQHGGLITPQSWDDDAVYIEKLLGDSTEKTISNKTSGCDVHIEELLKESADQTNGKISTENANEFDTKHTLDYLKTMQEVATANNMSLEEFSKVLFNSSSVKVSDISPRDALKKKLSLSRNCRKTKFASAAFEKKKKPSEKKPDISNKPSDVS